MKNTSYHDQNLCVDFSKYAFERISRYYSGMHEWLQIHIQPFKFVHECYDQLDQGRNRL